MTGTLTGKICLVTGGTDGIGQATAQGLAQMGATVVIVGRNPAKCVAVVNEIRQQTGNQAVEGFVADLSVMAEVERLANQFKEKYWQLHILVNNVGALFPQRRVTAEGFEMTFALNYLGQFLLTNLLLDTLRASTPARIINLSSDSHRSAALDFDDLQSEKRYAGYKTYGRSKLANVLFTYELARRLESTGVTANILNPGLVRTHFTDNIGLNYVQRTSYNMFMRLAGISIEEGAIAPLYLASSSEVEVVTGKYWDKQKAGPSSAASYDESSWTRLWQVSEELIGSKIGVAVQ